MLEARRNVTSTIASQKHVNSLARSLTSIASQGQTGSPKSVIWSSSPTGSPEPNNSLRPGASDTSRSIYSVSASAKTELLARPGQDLVVRTL